MERVASEPQEHPLITQFRIVIDKLYPQDPFEIVDELSHYQELHKQVVQECFDNGLLEPLCDVWKAFKEERGIVNSA